MTSAAPAPQTTAEEVAAAPGSREIKAARNVCTRAFQGIPQRAFLIGDSDHSPVLRSVAEFTGAVYEHLEALSDGKGPEIERTATVLIDMLENPVLEARRGPAE